ncbi:MAG: hypothetical protein JXQ77_05390 [Campylobacterales bacterium]|nr:hypothetical protein [Campylobacterales bacterium]
MRLFVYSIIVLSYFAVVLYLAIVIPITPNEAELFYASNDLVSKLMHLGDTLVGGLFGLRFFFLMAGLFSIALFYIVANDTFKDKKDAALATAIFAMLPGIIIGSVLANIAMLVLLCILLYLIAYHRKWYILEIIALAALFLLHDASILFFIAIAIYGAVNKEKRTLVYGSVFTILLIFLDRGIEIGGIPKGHFVEIFAIYASLFSPFVFLYFMYTIYRIWLREHKSIIWYISSIALFLSLLLSIRQRIFITDFAPYIFIGIIFMMQIYYQSLRVRLPAFQVVYKRGLWVSLSILIFSILFILLQPLIFSVTHGLYFNFTNKVYVPYLLSQELKASGKHCYDTKRIKESYQLQYYGITSCQN